MTRLTLLNETVFNVFWNPGEILEVRIITDIGRVVCGYFKTGWQRKQESLRGLCLNF